MMKNILYILLILFIAIIKLHAQNRDDINFHIETNDTKVSFASEAIHSTDFNFGIISAVNRPNTKAFSVFLGTGNNFNERFTIMGDGRVFASEVEIRTPIFPDYVFSKDYNLMSIGELETYIKKNQHLPKVPSAEKVINDGLALGKIQILQMEKIEELTLYIIELNKKIETLEGKLSQFKTKKKKRKFIQALVL